MKFEIGFEGGNLTGRTCRYNIEEAINDVFLNQHKGILPQEVIDMICEVDNCEYPVAGLFRNKDTGDIIPLAKISGTARTFAGMMMDREQKYIFTQDTPGYTLWDEWIDRIVEFNSPRVFLDRYFEFKNEENYKKLWSVHHNRFLIGYADFDAFWDHYEDEMQAWFDAFQAECCMLEASTRLEKATDPAVIEDIKDYLERKNVTHTKNIKLMNTAISERGTLEKPVMG